MGELIENIPDYVASLGPDGRIEYLNRDTSFGNIDRLLGTDPADAVAPADRAAWIDLVRRAGRTQQIHTAELRSIDGGWFSVRVVPVPTGGGGARMTVIATDVTVAKEAELTLRASEERLRSITGAALDAVVMVDAEGRVAHWNPAAERVFGYRNDEILGRSAHAVLAPPQYRDTAERGFREFAATGAGSAIGKVLELTALRKDGTEFPMEISVGPIRLEKGWGAVAIVRDVTRRRQIEADLENERRHLERLLAVHERDRQLAACELHDGLVQPLVATLMSLEGTLAGSHADLPDDLRSGFAGAMDLLRRGIAQARRLMTGLRPPILDQFGLVLAVENLCAELTGEDGPEIIYSAGAAIGRLAGPLETALFRIAQEAVDNALRHSGSREIRVRLSQEGDRVAVEIEDFGVGFDPAQPFPDGFGLEGMRERARLLGGRLGVRSEPGRGTRIRAEFPVLVPTSESEPPA